VGIFATVLDLAGIEAPPTLQGGSLAPLARGEADAAPGPVLSELHVFREFDSETPRPDPQMQNDRRYRLLREGSRKLVVTSKGDALLYDLGVDPGETRDLATERPEELAQLRVRLASVEREIGLPAIDAAIAEGGAQPELDEATRERLRALGYAE
jgi:arylsulfatase A-like enzyme